MVPSGNRFWYSGKTSVTEREFGLEEMPKYDTRDTVERDPGSAGTQNPRAGAGRGAGAPIYRCAVCGRDLQGGRTVTPCAKSETGEHEPEQVGVGKGRSNTHPSVKNVELMRYLLRLVVPPGGTVLDPFMGSGSTLMAAVNDGLTCIGIDQSEEYCQIAAARIGGLDVIGKMFGI